MHRRYQLCARIYVWVGSVLGESGAFVHPDPACDLHRVCISSQTCFIGSDSALQMMWGVASAPLLWIHYEMARLVGCATGRNSCRNKLVFDHCALASEVFSVTPHICVNAETTSGTGQVLSTGRCWPQAPTRAASAASSMTSAWALACRSSKVRLPASPAA